MQIFNTFVLRSHFHVAFWLTLAGLLSPAIALSQTKEQVYDIINKERLSRGLPALEIDNSLARSAQSWALFMPYSGKHNMNFISRRRAFKSQQKKEKIWGGEALAWGPDPVENWLKSYGHSGIVLGPKAKRMGLGYWRGKWVLRTLI